MFEVFSGLAPAFLKALGIVFLFRFTPLQTISLRVWFYLFCSASLFDVGSTFLVVYAYGVDWSGESNPLIHALGVIMPYPAALIMHSVLFYGLFYVAWRIGGKKVLPIRCASLFLFIAAAVRFIAGVQNIFLPFFMD